MKEVSFRTYLKNQAGVREEHLEPIMDLVRFRDFEKGEFPLREGQKCKHIFFIEKGLMRFYSISEEGKEHIVQFAPESWFISDRSSLYFDRPSDYFIGAIEDTRAVLLDEKFASRASAISPEFRNYNEQILQNHVLHLQNRINLLIGASAEERYLDFVRMYPDLTLRLPQWMIASYLGITPESLSRVRKALARRNFKGY